MVNSVTHDRGEYCERRERNSLYSRIFIIVFHLYILIGPDNFAYNESFPQTVSTNVYGQVPFKYEYENVISEIRMYIGTFALLRYKFVTKWRRVLATNCLYSR